VTNAAWRLKNAIKPRKGRSRALITQGTLDKRGGLLHRPCSSPPKGRGGGVGGPEIS